MCCPISQFIWVSANWYSNFLFICMYHSQHFPPCGLVLLLPCIVLSFALESKRCLRKDSSLFRKKLTIHNFNVQTETAENKVQDALSNIPANIRLDEDVLKTSFVFVFRRRPQNVLIKTNIFVLTIRLQDVSQKRFQDVFKTFWKGLQDVLQRYLQDVFKTYNQVKLFWPTRLQEVLNTFLWRTTKMVIYWGFCQDHTTYEKFMISVQNLQERSKFLKFFTLLYLLVAAYRGVFRTG